MHARLNACTAAAAVCLAVVAVRSARSEEPPNPASEATPSAALRQAAERGLEFLLKDATEWRNSRQCATCHHGTLTVWALSEAKLQGYAVDPDSAADFVTWAKERLEKIDLPRDSRPGWNMVSTPAIYLAVMAEAVPGQDAISADDLRRIAGHLARHQETDGSWAWSLAPPKNRAPPFFESDEVATLLAYAALGPQVPAEANEPSPVRESRDKAAAWLAKAEPTDTTQAAAFRLLVKSRAHPAPQDLPAAIEQFLLRQNEDGGWSQLKDLPSDAYATGQALYVLNLVGVRNDRAEVRRGAAFLVATQKADGSWPMTSRAHPGEKPASNPTPITYFGSAWATLGLMRSAAK